MNQLENFLHRAEALLARVEALLPPAAPRDPDFRHGYAYRWRKRPGAGSVKYLQAVNHASSISLDDLQHIGPQKEQIEQNTRQFVTKRPANNVLLTGARGTGKSSLIKACLNQFAPQGLRLIEVDKADLADLPDIVDLVAGRPERFVIFCDDLSFEEGEAGYKALKVALDGAAIEPGEGRPAISGPTLEELARKYVLASNVMDRLGNWMDVEALRAIADGLTLNLDDAAQAEASAVALAGALHDAQVTALFDERTDKHILRIERQHHGNTKASTITQDFVHGADYEALAAAGSTFKGLLSGDAVVRRGEGERQKDAKVADFRAAMAWLMAQAESAVGRQRYKGLGEMNPEQLWETTMDPTVRRLLKVEIEDAIEADHVFTMLMGDEVEPRRNFIELNALRAANIDV